MGGPDNGVSETMINRTEYPCHSLPKEQWCDHAGRGGFMGHTCIKQKQQQPRMKITAFELKLALLEYYRFGSQCVSVDEFNGADVIADTGKEIIEIEVKISKYDLVNGEKRKHKHYSYRQGNSYARCHPNKYLFCVPMDLVETAKEVVESLNPKYGIIGFAAETFEDHIARCEFIPVPREYLCVMKRAQRMHTNYNVRQTRLIAKRASAKLITLMQNQHKRNVNDNRCSC